MDNIASLQISDDHKRELIKVFLTIEHTEIARKRPDPPILEMVIAPSGGRRGAKSVKLTNITLNWKAMVKAAPGIVGTATAVAYDPSAIVLAGLAIASAVYDQAKTELDPRHAISLVAMWGGCDHRNRLSEDLALQLTNQELERADLPTLGASSFADVVDHLTELHCIDLVGGEIVLKERVKKSGWP